MTIEHDSTALRASSRRQVIRSSASCAWFTGETIAKRRENFNNESWLLLGEVGERRSVTKASDSSPSWSWLLLYRSVNRVLIGVTNPRLPSGMKMNLEQGKRNR